AWIEVAPDRWVLGELDPQLQPSGDLGDDVDVYAWRLSSLSVDKRRIRGRNAHAQRAAFLDETQRRVGWEPTRGQEEGRDHEHVASDPAAERGHARLWAHWRAHGLNVSRPPEVAERQEEERDRSNGQDDGSVARVELVEADE